MIDQRKQKIQNNNSRIRLYVVCSSIFFAVRVYRSNLFLGGGELDGAFIQTAMKNCGRYYAIEANPDCLPLLEKNLATKCPHVEVGTLQPKY